jgi:hypothetical protein
LGSPELDSGEDEEECYAERLDNRIMWETEESVAEGL